jgi:nicotinate-nucleotide adenylyltransferase
VTEAEEKQKIGLLGGTFDPVHDGHLAIAGRAEEALLLDRVIFIPAADPPHKKRTYASYGHRVAMLEAALACPGGYNKKNKYKKFEISLLEAERATPSYTVDTLLELKKRLGKQHFYFIIGADSLLELHLWYHYQDLPDLTDFIVVARPGITLQEISLAIRRLPGPFFSDKSQQQWTRPDGAKIVYLADVCNRISSSTIRKQLAQGQRPDTVDRRVLDYIFEHRLYQSDNIVTAPANRPGDER